MVNVTVENRVLRNGVSDFVDGHGLPDEPVHFDKTITETFSLQQRKVIVYLHRQLHCYRFSAPENKNKINLNCLVDIMLVFFAPNL